MPRYKVDLKPIIIKPLWRIVLNFTREVEMHYAYAYSKQQCLEIVFRRVAKKHDVPLQYVRGMFDGSKDNFKAEIDKEWKDKNVLKC